MVNETSASFLAGAFAGLVTDLSLHPIDTIKTKLQYSLRTPSNNFNQQRTVKLPASSFIKQLYRGLTPALCGSCPSGAAFFGTYQFIGGKNVLDIDGGSSTTNSAMIVSKSLVASSCAEASACLVRANVDIVKNNMQVGMTLKNAVGLLNTKRFTAAYLALMYRELPFAMIQLPLLELLKKNAFVQCIAYHISSEEHLNLFADKRVATTVVSGFIAGGTAAFFTTPFDVYKTRIVTAIQNNQQQQQQTTSFLNFLKTSFHQEGLRRGLFSGGLWRVTMISFGGAVFFGSQEWAKKKLLAK